MRLSTILSKNIIETTVGGLLNRFMIGRRRNVLFLGNIAAEYFKECEKSGYGKEMKSIGQEWMALYFKQLVPGSLKILPPTIFLNTIIKKVWVNLGLMSDIHVTKEDDFIKIKTKNEGMTEIIGKNEFMIGFYTGVLNILFASQIDYINATQTKIFWEYVFEIKNKPFDIRSKEKVIYDKLNYLPKIKGFTLKDVLRANVFQLKANNKLFFRDKVIYPIESTVLHLVGSSGILLDEVQHISYNFFKEIVEKNSSGGRKLTLLKTLLQSMGWGIIKITIDKEIIIVRIDNPPYGLQIEKDNWSFLVRMILGYLWLLDKRFKITNIDESYKNLIITYCK